MSLLETLVVGVDGSAASQQAADWAADRLAPGGTIHLVHAAHSVHASHPSRANRSQDRLTPPGGHPGRTETHMVEGEPADELLGLAERVGADAIVVGPHSKPRNIGTVGQVTRSLLQRSPCPLVVVKRNDPSPGPEEHKPPAVVACVGYGDATERAAMWAADYAADRSHPLTLLHVVGYRPLFPVDSPSDMLAYYFGGDVLRRWAREDLEEIQQRIEAEKRPLDIEATVEVGFASKAIVAAAAEAELMVLGKRHAGSAWRALISPRLHQLIIKSAATVAVVPSCFSRT